MNPAKTSLLAALLVCIIFLSIGCSSGGGSSDQSYFSGGGSKIYVASGHPEWWPIMYEALPNYAAEENFYMAISKKSSLTSFMPQINEAIARYKNNGTINNLMKGYFQSIMVRH